MDIKEYIESGLLEAFVLGELNDAESADVLSMAAKYPEIQEAINHIENTLEQTAMAAAIAPPAALRAKVLASLQSTTDSASTPLKITKKPTFSFWAAASIALLSISLGANLWLYISLGKEKEKVASLFAEQQSLVANVKKQEAGFTALSQKLKLLENPDIAQLSLAGTDNMPYASAKVYFNKKTGDAYLDIDKIAATAPGTEYQLWVLVDGKPVDMGTFSEKDASNIRKMKTLLNLNGKAEAFAVTIEKAGGSISPTLEKMILLGKFS